MVSNFIDKLEFQKCFYLAICRAKSTDSNVENSNKIEREITIFKKQKKD